ncbi:hypothetical protein AB0E01_32990 [Nocardia vinacea]|uniref:hypothetical protein n=1 Tax=Nocardia vinacea TaxID=96468 RepID=UPI0033D6342A
MESPAVRHGEQANSRYVLEAVSGLLADGLVAGDVDGKVVASGFQRLEAFRTGVLDGEQTCLTNYR